MHDWLEAEQRIERAQLLSESQRWEEALAELEAALAIHPENATWHAQRGYLLEELERWEEAAQAYETSLDLDPGDRDVSLALGNAYARLTRFGKALNIFEELARQYPDFEPAYCHRIQVYAELGRHDQAEAMFYLAQELDDRCPQCFYHIGASLAARGAYDRAIYCWNRVLELDAECIGVNRRIAQALRAKGDTDAAREHYLRELRDDPGNTDLLFEVAELAIESGQMGPAATKLAQIIELEPDHTDAHYALAKLALLGGQAETALERLDAARESTDEGEDLPGFDAIYGEALVQLQRYAEARVHLERAVKENPRQREYWRALGSCLLSLDKTEQAADAFRRVLARNQDDPFAHHHLGLCLLRQGRHEAGLKHAQEALRLKPDFAPAMWGAAVGLLKLARWREARRMLRRARELDPGSTALHRLSRRLWVYRLRHYMRLVTRPVRYLRGDREGG